MSAGKWRLLAEGETIQEGDQWHDHKTNLWAFAHQGVGDAVQTIDGPIRRRMTPAEEHAEELAAALDELWGWVVNWDQPFADDDEWPEAASRIKKALAKTEVKP